LFRIRQLLAYDIDLRSDFNLSEAPFSPPPTTGVAEPASWAMMILGFGLAGAAMRGRRIQLRRAVS
jgi:hypothetical protein